MNSLFASRGGEYQPNNMADKIEFLLLLGLFQCIFGQTDVPAVTTEAPTLSTTISSTTQAVTTTTRPPSTTIPPNTDLGPCTCDLIANGCDIECCCDPDCSLEDIQVFSGCKDQTNPADSQMCLQSYVIFLHNSPYTVNESVSGLFCVERDNYEERNYYKIPSIIDTESEFQEYIDKYARTSYQYSPSQGLPLNSQFYKFGDPIITIYENLGVGYLGSPQSINRERCADGNPAGYLKNGYEECERTVSDLRVQCTNNEMLNANTYFKYFKIVKSPGLLNTTERLDNETQEAVMIIEIIDSLISSNVDLYNSTILTPIEAPPPHICMDIDGLNKTCEFDNDVIPSPSLIDVDGEMYCQNAIIKVEYDIVVNGTDGIQSANVRFTFSYIHVSTIQLTQGFGFSYSSYGEEPGFQRSGNPGYQIGQVLLAGNLIQKEDIDRGPVQAMAVDRDQGNRFSIVTSSASGECLTDPLNRVPITFGENMRSGCTIKVTFNNMTEACSLLQAAATNALWGPYPPEYIASFGNTPVESLGDWVQIQVFGEPTTPAESQIPGTCNDIVLGLHIEIIYVNVGALGNPQAKVIGALYRFSEKENLNFQCVGRYCQPGTENTLEQSFEVISSVSFIDASEPAIGVDAKKPEFSARLPQDFFYPFK